MPKEVKFTEDELTKINEFQQRYVNIQMGFGQLEITKMRLHQQLDGTDEASHSLIERFETVQEEEREFIQGVNEKYGDGVLDPATGLFTPSEGTQEEATPSTDSKKE